MAYDFELNYFSTKIEKKLQLKNQLSIYPQITWSYPNIKFHHKKVINPHLDSESLSELKNSETGVSLELFLKLQTVSTDNIS